MVAGWGQEVPSRPYTSEGRTNMPENQSAYWATANSSSAPQHLQPSATSNDSRSRRRKPGNLRDSPRHRSEGANDHSHYLTPYYQQTEALHSAPATTATYAQALQPVSPYYYEHQPTSQPVLDTVVPVTQEPEMYAQTSYASQWESQWGIRPAATYPPAGYLEQRPHSYYEQPNPHQRTPSPSPPQAQRTYQAYRPAPLSQPAPNRPATECRTTEDSYVDPASLGLFAEALSGFADSSTPFSLTSPQSPYAQFSALPRIQTSAHSHPASVSHTSQPYAPAGSISQTSLAPPREYTDTRSPSQIFAEQLLMMAGDDDERPPDDELPDYAQSQAEEAAKRRAEASMRAKELEMRWAASRRG